MYIGESLILQHVESEQGVSIKLLFFFFNPRHVFKRLSQQSLSSPIQWNSIPQPCPTSVHIQNGYSPPIPPVHGQSPHTPYHNTGNSQSQYPAYYNTPSGYQPTLPGNQEMYPSMPPNMNYGQPYQTIPRPQSSAAVYPSHAYSNSYSQSPIDPSNPSMDRPHSGYRFPSNPLAEHSQPHYTEIPIPQTIGISSDYSVSPGRPYPCDLCALSFNRQHDLKRHRETHTGEKPYLCNGGCGKTFTRKDALKRHQVEWFSK